MQQLSIGTLLQGGKYRIERVLGQGGFGITYLAVQSLLERKVCIKEFFYKEYCERDEETSHVTLGTQSNQELVERFLNKFLKEARTISQLEHANIIHIHDIFKENNTAYYVMDYIEGESLSDKVRKGGPLAESSSIDYIKQVASALGFVHKRSINHLDVKPANIMVRSSDNRAVLIDFGLSKQYDSQGGQTSTTPVGISHGYAPMEQYNSGGVSTFSPQTDIYSLGATLYKLVTGSTPPQASDVLNDGLPEIPAHLSPSVKEAITSAMQVRKKDRPADIESFLSLLNTEIKAPVSAEKLETSVSSDEETKIVQSSSEDVSPRIMPEKESAPVDSSSSCHQEEVEDEAEEGNSSKKYYWIAIIVLIIGCLIYAYSQCSSNGYYNNSPNGYYLETDSVSDTINSYQEEPADTSAKVISKEESSSNKKQEEKQPSNAGARESSTAEEVVEVSQEGNKITQRVESKPQSKVEAVSVPSKSGGKKDVNWDANITSIQYAILKRLINNMVYVQGGTFTMGATLEQEGDADVDETPTHQVTLSGYYICKYEVTQEEWKAVMGTNPSYYEGSNKPVECVSWNDCQDFIKRLNRLTGLQFRLPTEAEWEYAARGGNRSRGYKYSGSNDVDEVSWYGSRNGTQNVGTKKSNELGLYDMSGNVYEWCNDIYGYYKPSSQTNPQGAKKGSVRVFRGGSWHYKATNSRVSFRYNASPTNESSHVGLRLCL